MPRSVVFNTPRLGLMAHTGQEGESFDSTDLLHRSFNSSTDNSIMKTCLHFRSAAYADKSNHWSDLSSDKNVYRLVDQIDNVF